MKLSIFARLVIGYLAIFVLAMTVSIYSTMQLRHLEEVTRSIHFVDNRVIDYEKKLSDMLLSMMRYERKFLIIKDEETYAQFLAAKNEFDMQLKEIMTVAESDRVSELLARINKLQKRYLLLFEEELVYLQSGEQYTSKEYEAEKETAVNGIMELLKELRDYTQQSTYRKISQLSEADVNASKVAVIIGVVSLISGIIISIVITVNITRPLSVIKKKTREVARGEFREDLNLTSPPEIALLAQAFNLMCARLKELDKMKSDFISLMSHELRTPLTTIREGTNLYLEGLQEGMVHEKKVRLMTIMNEECNRMINLVNSLLDLSKMESGMMPYNFMSTDIGSLIAKITNEMEPLAETKNIALKSVIAKKLPQLKIDTERMLQVLRNLIGNALKFTPVNGNVKIRAHTEEKGVKVSVSDTGTGISQDMVETVFDKYRQATLANTGKTQGTGLGLSIVRQIINDHGGKVWVEKTSEQGSTFSFVLPA